MTRPDSMFRYASDAELRRMRDDAYWEAARTYQEARRERDPDAKRALMESAGTAQAFWHKASAEIRERTSAS